LSDAAKISRTRQDITNIPFKLGEKSLKTCTTLLHILQSLQKFREKPLKNPEKTDKKLGFEEDYLSMFAMT
jgi:hypothetical protein